MTAAGGFEDIIAPGTPAPEFSLAREDGETFTRSDLLGGDTTVLVFYPFAFSPVCTDQLQVYDEVRDELAAQDVNRNAAVAAIKVAEQLVDEAATRVVAPFAGLVVQIVAAPAPAR